jgi:hypothetical protein
MSPAAPKERHGGFAKTVMNGKPGSSAGIEEEGVRVAIGRIREEPVDSLCTEMIANQFKK